MPDIIHAAAEVNRSYAVFTDPTTYKPFELTRDFMRIVGCIDPRDEDDPNPLKVIIQTSGGAGGRGMDSAFSLTATDTDGRVDTIEEGLEYDSSLERTTVAGGHGSHCRLLFGMLAVAREMQEPGDFTKQGMREFITRFDLRDSGIARQTDKIRGAVGRSLPMIEATNPDEVLQTIDGLYPYHPNVRAMRGENRAGFYIMNFHPYVGLDRERVHRGGHPLTVHAYHDSPRAMVDALAGTLGMSREIKDARLAAMLLRTAATRTVLYQGNAAMKFLNVVPTRRGLQVQEVML